MLNPDTLLLDLLAVLKDNPSLVATVGSSSNIVAYSPSYPTKVDLYAAVREINPPGILLAWTGTSIGDRMNGIGHEFSAFIVPNGKVAPVFHAFREGVVTASGQKFKLVQVVPGVHPTDVRGCFTRQLLLGEAVFEYHEIPLRITERGVDN